MKIIAVQNYGPSGTLFLHSLFDNHPEVIQLPGLIGVHLLKTIETQFSQKNKRAADLAGVFLSVYSPLYCVDHLSPDHGLQFLGAECDEHPCVDEVKFQEDYINYVKFLMIRDQLPAEIEPGQENKYIRVFFHAIYAAYAKGLGQDPSKKTVLVYPIHSGAPEQAIRMQEMFDECVFIHMIRHPINMMDSNVKYYQYTQKYHQSQLNIFTCSLSVTFQDYAPQMKYFYRMRSIYKYDRIENGPKVDEFSVQLEKLHTEPEETMATIAKRCGIDWSDSLLQSTFGGRQWWNRPGLRQMSGFNPEMKINKKLQNYPAFDRWRLRVLAGPLLEGLGYENGHSQSVTLIRRFAAYFLCLFPFKVERISVDGIRAIIVRHHEKAEAGDKQSQAINTVANAYWDARRRTSLFNLPVIDKAEEDKPGNKRVILIHRDKDNNLSSQECPLDTTEQHFASGVIQDANDPLIPKITWFKKVKAVIVVYLKEYIVNRKKLWEAHQEVRRRQNELIRPISDFK